MLDAQCVYKADDAAVEAFMAADDKDICKAFSGMTCVEETERDAARHGFHRLREVAQERVVAMHSVAKLESSDSRNMC